MILFSLVALTVMGSFDWRSSIRVHAATNEVCSREILALSNCSRDGVVIIDEARYGRMRLGRCFPTSSIGHFNCSTDVSSYVDALCSGRRSCNLTVNEALVNSPHRCPTELKGYLEIKHRCLKVEGQPPPGSGPSSCQAAKYVFRPEKTRGYLSPLLTDESGIGTSSCPWTIEVKSGQTINLTLLDFGMWKNDGWTKAPGDSSQSEGTTCTIYGRIMEKTRPQETPVCAGRQRQRWLYLSNSYSIQMIFNRNPTKSLQQFFLIKYEVVGCADPVSPPRTIVERKGDNVTLRCDDDVAADLPRQWTLHCVDGTWSGSAPPFNCSNRSPSGKTRSDPMNISGQGVVVVIAVAASLIVVVLIFTVGLLCICRRRFVYKTSTPQNPTTTAAAAAEVSIPLTSNHLPYGPSTCTPDASYPYRHPLADVYSRWPSTDWERDYATTLQMRLNAAAEAAAYASQPSLASAAALSTTAAGALCSPYDGSRTMLVYCPYHGTLSRLGEDSLRPRRPKHADELPPLPGAEQQETELQSSAIYHQLDFEQIDSPPCDK